MRDFEFEHGLTDLGIGESIGRTLVLGGRWSSDYKNARDLSGLRSIIIKESGVGLKWCDINIEDLVADFPDIEYLEIDYDSVDSLDWMSEFGLLKSVKFRCKRLKKSDEVTIGGVENLNISGKSCLLGLIGPSTNRLSIERLDEESLDFLSGSNLRELRISFAKNLVDLDGLASCGFLRRVDFYSLSKGLDISFISDLSDLQVVSFQSCRPLYYKKGVNLGDVKYLSILDCDSIASLKWVESGSSLERFRVAGTVVEDGLVGFLKEMPLLKHVFVEKRKGYDDVVDIDWDGVIPNY